MNHRHVFEVLAKQHPERNDYKCIAERGPSGRGCPHARYRGSPESCSQCLGIYVVRSTASIRDQLRSITSYRGRRREIYKALDLIGIAPDIQ